MLSSVRVLSVPSDHAYVRQALPADRLAEVRLSGPEARGWVRHPAFDPGWLQAHRGSFDVLHLHFGFDAVPPAELRGWTYLLRRLGIPLVLTVHDLRNPHHATRALHDAQLAVLVPAAAALATLTPGAAAEVGTRFGRTPVVVPHPRVLDAPVAADRRPGRVGLVLKRRAQVVDPVPLVEAVLSAVESVRGATLEVAADVAWQPALAAAGVPAAPLERWDDEGFGHYLSGLAVSVLPYRFGTHSGWLEACRDVGTVVVAPDCGYYAEQWESVVTYRHNETAGLDAGSLGSAVVQALSMPAPVVDRELRDGQAYSSRLAYSSLYRSCATALGRAA